MSVLTAVVTQIQMDHIMGMAYEYDVKSIGFETARSVFPARTMVIAECDLDFFLDLVYDLQASLEKLGPYSNQMNFLRVVELEPDAGHISYVTRSINFYGPYGSELEI